jgi:thiamine biosynthesis lipoprotein
VTAPGGEARFVALGTNIVVIVAEDAPHGLLAVARSTVERETAAFDAACSRFRDDSELMGLRHAAGRPTVVSDLLFEALEVALRAAALTDGRVDPTIGGPLAALGYDRDFTFVPTREAGRSAPVTVTPAPGWEHVRLDATDRTVTVPPGVQLDLGATAKARCADRAASAAHLATDQGVLVNMGGDIAVCGPPPPGGWSVQLSDDHAADVHGDAPSVAIRDGGLATSGTSVRRWARRDEPLHHLIDPTTGAPAAEVWRTATVAAGSCVDANIASTAAIILGAAAPGWLGDRDLPARLVRPDGSILTIGSWPEDAGLRAAGVEH